MSCPRVCVQGHGALTLAFKQPERWASVSAFSPICHPTSCPWGAKAFGGYLAGGVAEGVAHDAVALVRSRGATLKQLPILVDQGSADNFLAASDANGPAGQLQPEALAEALEAAGHPGAGSSVRIQDGYDHSYFFISTFIDEHVAWHADHLNMAS